VCKFLNMTWSLLDELELCNDVNQSISNVAIMYTLVLTDLLNNIYTVPPNKL